MYKGVRSKFREITDNSRVVFRSGRQRRLIEVAKKSSGETWNQFCKEIGISSYDVLRGTYLNERRTRRYGVVRRLFTLAKNLYTEGVLRNWIVKILPNHWWQAKGGTVSRKRWHNSMKVSDARRYHEIQARRFLDSAGYRYLTSAGYEVRSIYELIVAEGLISNSIDHKYEPMVWLHNRVCIPDFIAKAGEKHVFIEVTGMKWHVKYRQLKLKLVQLLETVRGVPVIVVHRENDSRIAKRISLSNVTFFPIDQMSATIESIMKNLGIRKGIV